MEKTIGARIKEARERRGMTQDQVAEKLDMKPANISSYERNKSVPPVNKLNLLANVLNTTTEYLLGKTENRYQIDEDMMKTAAILYEQLNDAIRHIVLLFNNNFPFSKKIESDLFQAINDVTTKHKVTLNIKIDLRKPLDYEYMAQIISDSNHTSFKIEMLETLKDIAKKYHLWEDPRDFYYVKENSVPYNAEKEFISKIDLSDEEILLNTTVIVDGRELSDREKKRILAQVRLDRQLDSQ